MGNVGRVSWGQNVGSWRGDSRGRKQLGSHLECVRSSKYKCGHESLPQRPSHCAQCPPEEVAEGRGYQSILRLRSPALLGTHTVEGLRRPPNPCSPSSAQPPSKIYNSFVCSFWGAALGSPPPTSGTRLKHTLPMKFLFHPVEMAERLPEMNVWWLEAAVEEPSSYF